jgi:hypothetical protein
MPVLTKDEAHAAGLKALNIARQAFVDDGHSVSAPGQSEAREFYVELDGVDISVTIEVL